MKKIVGIIAALALVAGVAFADDPSVTPSLVEFKGSAEFGWKADLDAETHGMYNNNSAALKITFVPKEVKKSTTGEPLWGELVIETGSEANEMTSGTLSVPSVSVKTAKIHFVDSDDGFFFHMDILHPGFGVGGVKGALATDTEKEFAGVDITGAPIGVDTPNGFTLKFGIPLISFDVAFGDNGEDAKLVAWGASDGADDPVAGATTKSKKWYTFKVATTIKPIDGLEIGAGIAKSTQTGADKLALGATAKYTYTIDGDMAVVPALAFSAYDMKNQKLGASVLFKWGPDGKEPGFIALTPTLYKDYMTIGNKCTSGVSVYFTKTLDSKDALGIDDDGVVGFAVYDNTLMSLIGEDAGDLSVAAKYTAFTEEFGKGVLALAAAYSNTFAKDSDLPIGFAAKFSFGMALAEDSDNTAIAYSVELTQKTLIANTELWIKYAGSQSKLAGAANAEKGAIDIGCKISL